MLIVCRQINKKYLDFPPDLVIEILSPSTGLKDRHIKYDIYESEGIKYYLIIDPETEHIEIYEFDIKEKKYYLADQGHDFQYNFIPDACHAMINFEELW